MNKRRIAILGSTGSIGTQALKVIEEHPDVFTAEVLTANSNVALLARQARKFKPDSVVIADESKYNELKDLLADEDVKVYAGQQAICDVVGLGNIDLVLVSVVGFAGLLPTISAIEAHKPIALANKETLVVAGETINRLIAENKVPLLPVDSEHSAIFQCLAGEGDNQIEKNSVNGFWRSVPQFHKKGTRNHNRGTGSSSSLMEHGSQDNYRLGYHDEQRIRGYRSQMAVRSE